MRTSSEFEGTPEYLHEAAKILEERFEEILATCFRHLVDAESPLIAEPKSRGQLRAQARSVLGEVARELRGETSEADIQAHEDRLSEDIGISRAREGIHAIESLRAATTLSAAALSVVVDELPQHKTPPKEVAMTALIIQKTVMERVMRAAIAYGNFLLARLHESYADERRRIARELHDRIAHSMIVAFRSLELYEVYVTDDPAKAKHRLERSKEAIQRALETTRDLSRELHGSSAEEGLEVALSDLLRTITPPGVLSWVSFIGDESSIAPQVRDELFLILCEAIRNAVTHSSAKKVEVKIECSENAVKAAVEDDGRGITTEKQSAAANGVGMSSMSERAEILGGTLNLTSVPGKGTKVEVYVPLPRS